MLRFEVNGKAEPAGSKRGFARGGRVQVVDANANAAGWKDHVADRAIEALNGARDGRPAYLLDGPLIVDIFEYRVRPKGHYGTRGLNKKGRDTPYPTSAPDTGKIARGIHDALTKVVYRDDSQIVDGRNVKTWGDHAHTIVLVTRADDRDDLNARYREHTLIAAAQAAQQQEALSG